LDLFKIFNRKPDSKSIAKSRLQLVLVQDRLNIAAPVLEMLKTDILKVISTYIEIDENELDIQFTKNASDGAPILIANIPVKELRKSKV